MALGKIKADTLEHSTAGSLDTQYVVNGSAKASANADDAASLQDSKNVSSGTDNGTGNYTYALSSAMSNSNFVVSATAHAGGSKNVVFDPQNASSFVLETFTTSNDTNSNAAHAFAVHGDLA